MSRRDRKEFIDDEVGCSDDDEVAGEIIISFNGFFSLLENL